MRLLEEQLVELVNVPNPGIGDMSLEGLVRWAPESVVSKAKATITSLDPSDRSTALRLAQNWTEQLHIEEDFINGVYHHLYYTLQMVWERVLKTLDSAADDVEEAQHKFQVGNTSVRIVVQSHELTGAAFCRSKSLD